MLSKGEGTTIPVIHESAQATDALRGIFITFEGGEGAGKTTHIRFLSETLRAHGREVLCLREPGGTEVGEQLRAVVLDPANGGMSDEAELLIYEAARAQLMAQVIAPALARGAVVLCDRFTDSTVAYQAYGRGLPRMFVDRVNEFACQGVHPDRTILMTTGGEANVGLVRATHRGAADRLEQAGEEFHARVNEAFLEIARRDPERVRVVVRRQQVADGCGVRRAGRPVPLDGAGRRRRPCLFRPPRREAFESGGVKPWPTRSRTSSASRRCANSCAPRWRRAR